MINSINSFANAFISPSGTRIPFTLLGPKIASMPAQQLKEIGMTPFAWASVKHNGHPSNVEVKQRIEAFL